MQAEGTYKEKNNKADRDDECLRSYFYWSQITDRKTAQGPKMLAK